MHDSPVFKALVMVVKSIPEQGQLVQIRSRPWVVSAVRANLTPSIGLPMPSEHREHLVSLSSVEDDGLGEELQVVWEIEPGAKILERITLPAPLGLDSPEKLDAFLDAVRWGAASLADQKNIQSPFRSGIVNLDYVSPVKFHLCFFREFTNS